MTKEHKKSKDVLCNIKKDKQILHNLTSEIKRLEKDNKNPWLELWLATLKIFDYVKGDRILTLKDYIELKELIKEQKQDQTQKIYKMIEEKIENVGIEDIISFLENLKKVRILNNEISYEDGKLPFGTCDYMTIDDMISRLNNLKNSILGEKHD